MSNRQAVPDAQKDTQWMRDIEDRVKGLETRKVQGNLTLADTTLESLTVGASRTTPVVYRGSEDWTQAVENLGRSSALVTRDALGVVQDIAPAPFTQLFLGNSVGVVPGPTGSVLTWIAANVSSGPYSNAQMYDIGQGALVTPVDGVWILSAMVVWNPAADATLREVFMQVSSDGGATYGDIFPDTRPNVGAGNPCYQSLSIETNSSKGFKWRLRVIHTSAVNPLICTGVRFQQTFLRSASIVV